MAYSYTTLDDPLASGAAGGTLPLRIVPNPRPGHPDTGRARVTGYQ